MSSPSNQLTRLMMVPDQVIDFQVAQDTREMPGSEIMDSNWSARLLQITCVPFNELEQSRRIEDADDVRYAEVNSDYHLIVPGGVWKLAQLVKAVV